MGSSLNWGPLVLGPLLGVLKGIHKGFYQGTIRVVLYIRVPFLGPPVRKRTLKGTLLL